MADEENNFRLTCGNNKKFNYVKKGVVDFNYSGPFTFNGKTYTIKKGIKV